MADGPGYSERPQPQPSPPLPLMWLRDITPNLDAQDFVQGLLMMASAAVVYGESNSGKTFWTTDLALHIAAGLDWNGRRVDKGGVIYCVLEGGHGFRNRVAAWRWQHLQEADDIPFAAIPSALNLLDPTADIQRLLTAIERATAAIGEPVKLVVIDTLSRALAGGDENSSEDMGALVRAMDLIREATTACVLFVHHSGKDAARGARGHSLLRAAIDTEIEVVTGEHGARTATVVKQRDLAKGDAFAFRLVPYHVGDNRHGEPVTTCTVKADAEGEIGGRTVALTPDERGWLKDVASFFDDPTRGEEGVCPAPGSSPIRAATRNEIRGWLVQRGRLGVAGSAAGENTLTATERSQLARNLNRLKDKGKIGIFNDWIWLI